MGWVDRMQSIVQMVYPPRCLSCGAMVDEDFGLCAACWKETPFIAGLSCDLCGKRLSGQSDREELCDDCLTIARPWSRGRAALVYEGRARRLVLALKHGDRHDIAKPAAQWMARITRPIVRPDTLVVPIPLHVRRHLSRRYNQSALLAQTLADVLDLDYVPDLLHRVHPTPMLKGKSRDERFEILAGQLQVTPSHEPLVAGRSILVVDDVMTSGATLAAAADACLACGASEVFVSVLARAGKEA
ncbi:ComF family protein [Pacificoceanicola onchidii]|uniref:ComF family protein n=1 Tax=Pacificoceanicola onchidii TaxID=2562685 RepID=UPI001F0D8439|nr:double zinc ribbon domain-containing protein [Pacificoceanicola onchidii]